MPVRFHAQKYHRHNARSNVRHLMCRVGRRASSATSAIAMSRAPRLHANPSSDARSSAPGQWLQSSIEYHLPLIGQKFTLLAPGADDRQAMRGVVEDAMQRGGWVLWTYAGSMYPVYMQQVAGGLLAHVHAPDSSQDLQPLLDIAVAVVPEDAHGLWQRVHAEPTCHEAPARPWAATQWHVQAHGDDAEGRRGQAVLQHLLGHVEARLAWAYADWFLRHCHAMGVTPLMPTL